MLSHPPVEGNTCNLECLKRNAVKTFEGPVKIVLVDIPRREYCRRIWWAGFVAFAYILMGFYTIVMLLYSASWTEQHFETNLHIFFCTAGFQLLMPAGILMTTYLHGPTIPLKPRDRKINHIILQLTAAILNITGSALLLVSKADELPDLLVDNTHCLFGVIALSLMTLGMLIGPCVLAKATGARCFRYLHAFFGLTAYVFSSICFVACLFSPDGNFLEWINKSQEIAIFMACICILATLLIVSYGFMKLLCCYERHCDNSR